MGDQDWLENGHGGGEDLQPMIKGSSAHAFDRVSIRSVLRGTDTPTPRRPRRRNKALVGWLLYCATAVGGTAAAFTVRDTLFPSLATPTENRVWPDPQPVDTTATIEHGSASAALSDTSVDVTVATTIATTALSVEDQTVPAVADTAQGPSNSIDNHGPGAATAPGTTVADNPTQGPGPGTTVDAHPTETSTPGSASTPPTSADAPVTSAAPAAGDGGHQNGKGGGGGSGGGGGGGGGGGDQP